VTTALPRLGELISDGGMAARAVRSTGFTVLRFGGQNALRLAGNLVLTRLLFPEAFGLMAIVQVVLAGAAMVSDFGIRGAIVQDARGDDPDFLDTAWTLQILRGFVLGGAVALAAGPLAAFYDAPRLADLLLVAAIVPVIQGFASTRLATASRRLALGRMAALHLGAQAAGLLAMIAMAVWLGTVWALMLGALVAPALVAGLSHVVLPGTANRLRLDRDALGRLFGFGKYIFLATIAGFVIGQGDKAVLAKFVSLGDLAIYNIAFFLAAVPALLAQKLTQAVLFPLYARRPPAACEANRARINRARVLITGALLAGLCALALIGDGLVRALYDPRYHGAGPWLVLIALAAMPRVITASYAALPLAAGHSGRYAVLMVGGALIQLGALLLGARAFGMLGVVLAPFAASLLFYPLLVLGTRAYGGWDRAHDLAYHLAALVAAALIFTVHGDLLMALFRGT
jgi:O-antigen/teichoic acid export membrane protein